MNHELESNKNTKIGKFYSVGIGPGDEKLITIKAVETLKYCDIVCIPDSGSGNNIALDIIKNYVEHDKIKKFPMPMIKGKDKLKQIHKVVANEIEKLLNKGLNCAFVTLGDPSIYATASYINKILKERLHDTEVVAGVTSFCGAAARLQIPLCEGNDTLTIVPFMDKDYLKTKEDGETTIFMKCGKQLLELKESLLLDKTEEIYCIEKATMKDEKILYGYDEITENTSYFTLVIAKKGH